MYLHKLIDQRMSSTKMIIQLNNIFIKQKRNSKRFDNFLKCRHNS